MALTITNRAGALPTENLGGMWCRILDVDFDASYPTGGESLNEVELGFPDNFRLLAVIALPRLGYVFEYDYTNLKLLAYYSDYDAVADGALIQVPNTTNLSTVTDVRVIAIAR